MSEVPLRLLLIEDNPGDARLIQDLLAADSGQAHELLRSATLAEGLALLGEERVDAVLLDLGLPDSQGLETFDRAYAAAPRLPILVLTGFDDHEAATEAVRRGAQDYIVKGDLSGHGLGRAIAYALERRQTQDKLEHLNALLRSIRRVNQLITSVEDRDLLLEQACAGLLETRGWPGAWIVLQDETGQVTASAHAGVDGAFPAMLERIATGAPPPCVLRTRDSAEVQAFERVEQTCVGCPLAAAYPAHGAMAARLEHAGQIYGVMAVSTPPRFTAGVEEQGLFAEAAHDVAYALHKLELQRDHRRTKQRLDAAEHLWAKTFDAVSDAVWLLDREFKVLRCNAATTTLLGKQADEIVGRRCYEVVHGTDQPIPECPVMQMRESGAHEEMELQLGDRHLRVVCDPFIDEAGELQGAVHTISDITALKQAEERVRHLNEVLRAIRNVNQLITRERDRDRLLQQACESLVETRGWQGAWIVLLDGQRRPELSFQAGLGDAFGEMVARLERGALPDCMRRGLESGEVIALARVKDACGDCPLAAAYSGSGTMVMRLQHDGELFGFMAVSAPGFHCTDAEEQSLFAEAVGDVAFALHNMQLEVSRAAAETSLRDSQERWRAVTDSSADYVIVLDRELRITFVNGVEPGLSMEQLIGAPLYSFVEEADRERVKQALQRALERGEAERYETSFARPDGEHTYFDSRAAPMSIGDERVGLVVTSRDISDRKRTEHALRESEEISRTLVNTLPLGVVLTDLEGRIRMVNRHGLELCGFEREEAVIGLNLMDLVAPDDRERASANMALTMQTGSLKEVEYQLRRQDGALFPGELSVSVLRDTDGSPSAFVAVIRDVTERRRAAELLTQEKERAQLLLDIAPVTIVAIDADERVSLINQRGCEVFEAQEEQILGRNWFGYFLPERNRAQVQELFQRLIAGETAGTDTFENPIITPGGKEKLIRWHNQVRRDEQGKVIGTLSAGEDVTERKRIQVQLAQSDRMASIGMLAAGVAHEINNPLAYIIYNLESATEDVKGLCGALLGLRESLARELGQARAVELAGQAWDQPDAELLNDIEERLKDAATGAWRVRDIVRDLKVFSRVEDDTVERTDMCAVVESAANMAKNEIKYRARLVKELGEVPAVMANEGRLSQVFLNLLINAAQAIDEGDVANNEIRVRSWKEGDQVCVEVRDSGRGIPPDQVPVIFDPFFTTKPAGIGSGLGLPICQSIVTSYGGLIDVQSSVGKGTSITVRLPLSASVEERDAGSAPEVIEEPASQRGRVLVVDDDPLVGALTRRVLARQHDVTVVDSGAAAMKLLDGSHSFDLILCDVMMPEVTGIDLYQWLEQRQPELAARLVFMTGGVFTPKAREFLQQRSQPQLEKPFEPAELRRRVRELIDRG